MRWDFCIMDNYVRKGFSKIIWVTIWVTNRYGINFGNC